MDQGSTAAEALAVEYAAAGAGHGTVMTHGMGAHARMQGRNTGRGGA